MVVSLINGGVLSSLLGAEVLVARTLACLRAFLGVSLLFLVCEKCNFQKRKLKFSCSRLSLEERILLMEL